jgi:hypothetical protein
MNDGIVQQLYYIQLREEVTHNNRVFLQKLNAAKIDFFASEANKSIFYKKTLLIIMMFDNKSKCKCSKND